ncbi:hypothetical protein HY251_22040 [bacterium]|nr:hypothetical protein [bacterium]
MAWEDPEKKGSLLSLKDLVERGLVHEVWMLCHHEKARAPFETVEAKQLYDEKLARKDGHTLDAGNSGDTSHVPWLGRSLRILFFNPDRGCGCAMESLGHSLEHMATSDAIPYFKKYFVEYAMLDLDKRYGLPFDSLYAKGPLSVSYPTPTSMIYRREGKDRTLEGYVVSGGNVHFVPNGRTDYDMTNDQPVRSTIGHWRERDGEGGKDRSELWLPAVLEPYEKVAPDCMGKWVVYWRQRMPGLDNAAKDDDGKPMKNWWPFLFY